MMQIHTKVFNVLHGTFLLRRIQEHIKSDTEGLIRAQCFSTEGIADTEKSNGVFSKQ